MSNSTLRRKLFEGAAEDECDQSDEEKESIPNTPVNEVRNCKNSTKERKILKDASIENISPQSPKLSSDSPNNDMKQQFDRNEKENYQYVNVNITPGAMILTPKANSVGPTPDRSVSKIMVKSTTAIKIP